MNVTIPEDFGLYAVGGVVLALILSNLFMRALKRHKPKWHKRILSWRFRAGVTLLILLFIAVVLVKVVFIKIDSGQVGVIWKRFGGTYVEHPFYEGTVLVYPWDTLTIYSSRFQTTTTEIHAITSEGLRIKMEITVRYRPVVEHIPYLHKLVGEDYLDEIVIPEVASAVRMIVSDYTAEEVYANQRLKIQDKLLSTVLREVQLQEKTILKQEKSEMQGHNLVNLDDMLIRHVDIPEGVHNAIIAKVNQMHLYQEYEMRLDVAEKEAERKKVEAMGIADFQEKVSGGISETYLRWRGIEATIELAKSNNAKVVVIGSGKDGLPLILNTENGGSALPASVQPVAGDPQNQEPQTPNAITKPK
ncbi:MULTISPECIES: prohibitin family protein [Pseudoalteromonas]|uniref:Band 7 domain-containing protein n=1 Tax=Pseudoalteromonas peptidolytica F12-50-A1 TaxID=1315280 RepID=A0A8I0MWN8_9GAMM|nr:MULTISPECIES: prohibitin family protein [Pseudoalteromonas]MBE0347196.1 hypothetical protein [Pseudoalteromonas peptidolytica F12-50-A1]MDW7549330.1 prohibitin family protein [Pseudoalteromonas peptidolytica]NLR13840.1 prohibitin family protein [Pseudoalteromonas peptidolytica]RRS09999.1 prohibitin family protein [Pseudoalteromonas sp. J010]RXF05650.1 prohibitin family protein [Pseudoalteromonas sp. PS5]